MEDFLQVDNLVLKVYYIIAHDRICCVNYVTSLILTTYQHKQINCESVCLEKFKSTEIILTAQFLDIAKRKEAKKYEKVILPISTPFTHYGTHLPRSLQFTTIVIKIVML